MKKELRSWFGQSIVEKLVTGGVAMLGLVATTMSTQVTSEVLQHAFMIAAIAGGCTLIVLIYLNRRLAKIDAEHQRYDNLFAVVGYIIRHRIHEHPRTDLDRHVQIFDTKKRERAVSDTIDAHCEELRKWINEEHPEVSVKEIEDLLCVFYDFQPKDEHL
ncbi:MAG: hypothetical protein KF843_11915 [Flavobacteriales bacterium]|nr:hypothetical protein [Flavobacteriales bacterium]